MNRIEAKPELIPRQKRQRPSVPLLKRARAAFEDPQIVKEFKDWQEARETKKRSTGT